MKIHFITPIRIQAIKLLPVLLLFLFSGCKKDISPGQDIITQTENDDGVLAARVVHAGNSIQSAIDAVKPGSVIKIEPGVYKEAIKISKPGITIIGITRKGEGVVIKNPGDEDDGITVTKEACGFTLKNVTVQGFEENGVILIGVDGFLISHVTAINNGEYGIFPVFCSNGTVEYCVAFGHSDTGIYIGQSRNVEMRFNEAYANVNGLEVENSHNINVQYNRTHNNVAGMLIDVLPGKKVKSSSNIHISFNFVSNNNHKNFGEEGSLESVVPKGIGILILGTDKAIVERNVVEGNNFLGIGTFSTLVLGQLAGLPPDAFKDIDPNPDNNQVRLNLLLNNGSNPPQIPDLPLPGVDLLWDGSGTGNCWSGNVFTSTYPSPLPACN
ncbi:MAG: parallel beta-helix domain-containing protein [Ilyomonas sp.]